MDRKKQSAFDAICEANKIACAPFIFQAVYCLREFGIFSFLDGARFDTGATYEEISREIPHTQYAIKTLLEAGESFKLLEVKEGRYFLTKTAWFLMHDAMTKANFDFSQDVCYQGLFYLKKSFEEGRPVGLETFTQGEKTIYPFLSRLPEMAKTSWFAFDHFYSDVAYDQSLPLVFENKPKEIFDIGGNTGKFSLKCCRYDGDVHITIFDLPQQCHIAQNNAVKAGFGDRISTSPIDLLSDTAFSSSNADIWWMSQFLDCFSEDRIVSILKRIAASMKKEARVYILEPLIGEQPFEIGNLCVAAYSLYFAAIANGTSKFYKFEDFERLIEQAGLTIETVHRGLGVGHSLLVCKVRD